MIAAAIIALIGALHLYIMVLEMALWQTPRAMKAFGTTPEFALATKVMAANQGLYNGLLAAGLFWSLWEGKAAAVFFLIWVLVAGIFGAATVSRRILFVQAVPAGFGLLALGFGV